MTLADLLRDGFDDIFPSLQNPVRWLSSRKRGHVHLSFVVPEVRSKERQQG